MILYPFQPDVPFGYGIAGYDEVKKTPAGELYLLAPGAQPPAEFTGGFLFCEAPGCRDARLLQPVRTAAPDARAVWCDTQVSGGSLEGYLRELLPRWGDRLWVCLVPIRMLFPVPCPSGLGEALDTAAADALCAQHPPHFSPELACCYSYFLDSAGQPRVFLFDTDETCREKLALLRRLGVRQVFGIIPQQTAQPSRPVHHGREGQT